MEGDSPETTKDKLSRLFGDWHSPIPDLIKNTEHILKNSLIDREPHKGWTKGRVTLLGDAAHPTTPKFGPGRVHGHRRSLYFSQLNSKIWPYAKGMKPYNIHDLKKSIKIV
ncbi:hypothetical protein [Cyclobacterium marinum]|uniref:hypothetical protein n=1 Tax=Cyclobacterium marinum TaxID=104 RepID=UPI0011EFEF2D|nr:hypothetical protein [Cyclobacterium marinum]MBI0400800.1 hypothetical protein [Cyclobacterium marinum]